MGSNPTAPTISRRAFLGAALAAPAVTYFLAPRGGWRPWESDFTTDALRYKSYERMSVGVTDWRGIYGSGGAEGWTCINGHPYCNLCMSPVDLTEESLEKTLVQIRESVGKGKIALSTDNQWYLKTDDPQGLKRFERTKPIIVSPGRRWFRA